jgi:hypothetical protein
MGASAPTFSREEKLSILDLRGKLDQIWIRAKGPTWHLCPEEKPPATEIWGLNSSYKDREGQMDRMFIIHDIRETMFHEAHNLVPELNALGIPIHTAGTYQVLDNCCEFPVKEIINRFGREYMVNAIAWMIAMACYLEPKELHLYGVDYAFGVDLNEKGSTEYWLGRAEGMGIKLHVPMSSHILKPPWSMSPLYGYVIQRSVPDGLTTIIPNRIRPKCAAGYELIPKRGLEELE